MVDDALFGVYNKDKYGERSNCHIQVRPNENPVGNRLRCRAALPLLS